MITPRQSFWPVGACVIMFPRSAGRLAGMLSRVKAIAAGVRTTVAPALRLRAASISMLISLAPLRENVYFCVDEVFRSDIVSAVVPVFRGQAGQRERGLICRKPVFCFRTFVIRECC